MLTTAEVKEILIRGAQAHRHPHLSKLVREGMDEAAEAIRRTPLEPSLEGYLIAVKARIEQRKQRWRDGETSMDGWPDEDGWLLGGASTILRMVERAEEVLKKEKEALTREALEAACDPV